MHELSIASFLLEQVKRHTPEGARVLSVRVLIGPLQAIEPESLRFSWKALWEKEGMETPRLDLDLPGWALNCPRCGRTWESEDRYVACRCGAAILNVDDGGELQLISIEIEDPGEPDGNA